MCRMSIIGISNAQVAADFHPIAICPHASLLKIVHWCYLTVCLLGFSRRDFLTTGLGLGFRVRVTVRFPCDLRYESWTQKTGVPGLPDGDRYIILCSGVSTSYRIVIDGWRCLCLSHSTAEYDKDRQEAYRLD